MSSTLDHKRSGGPKTPEGKAKSRMNALKHGAYAVKIPVLRTESAEAYREHVRLYFVRFNPADEPERNLVAQIAFIDWRLTRLSTLESHVIDLHIAEVENSPYTPDGAGQADATVAGINRALQQPCLNWIGRRESALARQRSRFLKDLAEMRRSHPILDPEPEFLPDAVQPGDSVEPAPIPKQQSESSLLILPPFTPQKSEMKERTPSALKPHPVPPPRMEVII